MFGDPYMELWRQRRMKTDTFLLYFLFLWRVFVQEVASLRIPTTCSSEYLSAKAEKKKNGALNIQMCILYIIFTLIWSTFMK